MHLGTVFLMLSTFLSCCLAETPNKATSKPAEKSFISRDSAFTISASDAENRSDSTDDANVMLILHCNLGKLWVDKGPDEHDLSQWVADLIKFNSNWLPVAGQKIAIETVAVAGKDARRIEFITTDYGYKVRHVEYFAKFDGHTYGFNWSCDDNDADTQTKNVAEIMATLKWTTPK